jgi:CRP-like cAMP-binding protein
MGRPTIDERLAEVPLFRNLSKKQLGTVAKLATPLDLAAGRELTTEGRPGAELFVVIEGEAEIRRGGKLVATRGPGTFLGEMALLLDRTRSATVVARTDMTVEVIGRSEFKQLLAQLPELYEPLLAAVAERLAELEDS